MPEPSAVAEIPDRGRLPSCFRAQVPIAHEKGPRALCVSGATPRLAYGWFERLDRANLLSARTFGAAALLVFNGLALPERLDARSLEGRVMEEQLAVLPVDETKTPVRHQLLDGTLRHVHHSSKNSIEHGPTDSNYGPLTRRKRSVKRRRGGPAAFRTGQRGARPGTETVYKECEHCQAGSRGSHPGSLPLCANILADLGSATSEAWDCVTEGGAVMRQRATGSCPRACGQPVPF